jgi:predicted secreted hydrolase
MLNLRDISRGRRQGDALRRALESPTLSFPRDHGQHSDFRTEWWYLSGHLHSEDGSDWAYHFTIFRRALEKWTDLALVAMAISSRSLRNIGAFQRALARMLENQNSRRIRVDGYVGHLAITNIAEHRYEFLERAGTSLFEVAGARDDCLCAWVKGWKLQERAGAVQVVAERHGFGIELDLLPLKPPILQGNRGLTMKGPEPGQASYHYSMAPLKTTGKLTWDGKPRPVTGSSLMDREFGTAMLPKSVRGWDWFGLMLDNNHEMMISLIRTADGGLAATSSATVIRPDGSSELLTADRLRITAVELWTSPATGARYPVHWNVDVEQIELSLGIRAVISEHELISVSSTTVDYWEGPVHVSGTLHGQTVTGNGHVELVGYSQAVGGKF